jgi:RNA polymerase sigma-70 factor, ECF subfamily
VHGTESGHPSWCERLYHARAPGLILYGRALGLSHSEAEDVLHETFATLLRRQNPPDQPDHYCVRAFRNRALNYRRTLWRRLKRELESHRWFERTEDDAAAERAAMRRLTQLPMEQREAIVLKIWHRYTFQQIGLLLGLSPNTVAARYRYGLDKLRANLKGTSDEQLEPSGNTNQTMDPASPLCET